MQQCAHPFQLAFNKKVIEVTSIMQHLLCPPLANFIISSIAIKEFFNSAVTWHHVLLLSIALPVILGNTSPLKIAFPRQLIKQVLIPTNWLQIGLPFLVLYYTNVQAKTKMGVVIKSKLLFFKKFLLNPGPRIICNLWIYLDALEFPSLLLCLRPYKEEETCG